MENTQTAPSQTLTTLLTAVEKAKKFAKSVVRDNHAVLAVAVDHIVFDRFGDVKNEAIGGPFTDAENLATVASMAVTKLKAVKIDMYTFASRAVAHYYSEILVSTCVVIPIGDPAAKSIQRKIARAHRDAYGR